MVKMNANSLVTYAARLACVVFSWTASCTSQVLIRPVDSPICIRCYDIRLHISLESRMEFTGKAWSPRSSRLSGGGRIACFVEGDL